MCVVYLAFVTLCLLKQTINNNKCRQPTRLAEHSLSIATYLSFPSSCDTQTTQRSIQLLLISRNNIFRRAGVSTARRLASLSIRVCHSGQLASQLSIRRNRKVARSLTSSRLVSYTCLARRVTVSPLWNGICPRAALNSRPASNYQSHTLYRYTIPPQPFFTSPPSLQINYLSLQTADHFGAQRAT